MAGLLNAIEGDRGRLLQAAGRQQPVGVVDDRPQREDYVACLRGQANRRLCLVEPGVGFAVVDENAAQRHAGGGLLGAGADLPGHGRRLLRQPPRLREAVHQHQQVRKRAQHPRPLH
jgi:uncharacterized protein (DUF2236 family)